MSVSPVLHEHPAYAYDSVIRQHPETPSNSSSSSTLPTITTYQQQQQQLPVSYMDSDEIDDPYDECKESPLIDTLVEGAVVILIALLINITFWGIIRFSDDPNVVFSPTAIA